MRWLAIGILCTVAFGDEKEDLQEVVDATREVARRRIEEMLGRPFGRELRMELKDRDFFVRRWRTWYDHPDGGQGGRIGLWTHLGLVRDDRYIVRVRRGRDVVLVDGVRKRDPSPLLGRIWMSTNLDR